MAVGLAVLAAIPETVSVRALAALMVPVGLAGPLIMPPITALLLNSVPDAQAGTASGVFNTSRQVGGALAVAVFGALHRRHRLHARSAAQPADRRRRRPRRRRHRDRPTEPDRGHVTDHALLEGLA